MKILSPLFIALAAILSFSSAAKAQDTLLMKSGVKVASQIIEITPTLVRYKKADNPDGPTFVINAYDIHIIKYRNGTTDTINAAAPAVAVSPTPSKGPTVVAVTPVVPTVIDPHPPLYPAGMFYRYQNRRIKTREMQEIVGLVRDPEIDMHVKKAKTAKGLEYIGYLAIPTFAFGVGYTFVAFVNNEFGDISSSGPYGMSYTPGTVSFVVAAASLATSITFKIVGRNHNAAAVKLYNEKY